MHVALWQMTSTDNVDANLQVILDSLHFVADQNPRPEIIIFPENALYFRIGGSDEVMALQLDDPRFQKIEELVSKYNIAVHLTTPILQGSKKFNSSVLIKPGSIQVQYNKIHLFDISLKEQVPILESQHFEAGKEPKVFEFNNFSFGSSICYDIRFSELYSYYAKKNIEVLLVPSAFLVKTGKAHWLTLLRARAIESQCYILAPAQFGKHVSDKHPGQFRETFGHTVAFDPWGELMILKDSGNGLSLINLEKARIEDVRRQIPMSFHRRL